MAVGLVLRDQRQKGPGARSLCDRIQRKKFAEGQLQFFAAFAVVNVRQSSDSRTQETLEFTTGKHFPVDFVGEELRVTHRKRYDVGRGHKSPCFWASTLRTRLAHRATRRGLSNWMGALSRLPFGIKPRGRKTESMGVKSVPGNCRVDAWLNTGERQRILLTTGGELLGERTSSLLSSRAV